MLIDEDEERSGILKCSLAEAGYDVVERRHLAAGDLLREVDAAAPDLIIIDTQAPDRDTLEHLCVVSAQQPRPIVMFSGDRDSATIRAAVRAGVSAYVVDGLAADRIQPVIDAAVARFEQLQSLRDELTSAQVRLDERKRIEKAKGLLMERKRVSEDDAFRLLRKLSMDRNQRLVEVADEVIRMSDLL
jgi:response regulator NasT